MNSLCIVRNAFHLDGRLAVFQLDLEHVYSTVMRVTEPQKPLRLVSHIFLHIFSDFCPVGWRESGIVDVGDTDPLLRDHSETRGLMCPKVVSCCCHRMQHHGFTHCDRPGWRFGFY